MEYNDTNIDNDDDDFEIPEDKFKQQVFDIWDNVIIPYINDAPILELCNKNDFLKFMQSLNE